MILLKTQLITRLRAADTRRAKLAAAGSLWVDAAGSKLVVLELVDLVFRCGRSCASGRCWPFPCLRDSYSCLGRAWPPVMWRFRVAWRCFGSRRMSLFSSQRASRMSATRTAMAGTVRVSQACRPDS